MGDRANVYVKGYNGQGVYLYTHWSGYELPGIVRDALARGERHSDGAYLARIVFQQMLDGDDGTTGYGISATLGDNSHPIIVLDPQAETVAFAEDGQERAGPYVGTVPMREYAAREGELRYPGDEADEDEE